MFEALRVEQNLGRLHTLPGPWELAWEAEHLEGARPQEILEWAVETYGEGLALSASFGGAEGMTLIDMISKITDEVTILTIDTGFLFEETHQFREEVMRRYRLPLKVLKPVLSGPVLPGEEDRAFGEGFEGVRGVDDGDKARADASEGEHEGGLLGGEVRDGQGSAAGRLEYRAGVGVRREEQRVRQPAAVGGLQEHRVRAADQAGLPGGRCEGGALVGDAEDRVRSALGRRAGTAWAFLGEASR